MFNRGFGKGWYGQNKRHSLVKLHATEQKSISAEDKEKCLSFADEIITLVSANIKREHPELNLDNNRVLSEPTMSLVRASVSTYLEDCMPKKKSKVKKKDEFKVYKRKTHLERLLEKTDDLVERHETIDYQLMKGRISKKEADRLYKKYVPYLSLQETA